MKTLCILFLLAAPAFAQEGSPADQLKREQNRMADLQRRFQREKNGTNEKRRLQMEIRLQRSRLEELVERQTAARGRLEELNAQIEADPGNAVLWAQRGTTYHQLGDKIAAEKDFVRAVELQPGLAGRLAHLRTSRTPTPKMRPEMERVRAYIEEYEPETYRQMVVLQKEGKRAEISRMFRDAEIRMRDLAKLKEKNPRAYVRMMSMRDLEREAITLADQAKQGPPEAKDAVAGRLTAVLNRLFDLREEYRAEELKQLRDQVQAFERALEGRKARKAEIVEKRLAELLR